MEHDKNSENHSSTYLSRLANLVFKSPDLLLVPPTILRCAYELIFRRECDEEIEENSRDYSFEKEDKINL
jgi:hypothetical protein